MLKNERLFLLSFQLYFSFFWNTVINFVNNNRFHILSLVILLLIINFKFFGESTNIRLSLIVIFFLLNLVLLTNLVKVKKFKVSFFLIKKKLEEKLNFSDYELFSYFDKEYFTNSFSKKNQTHDYIWIKFKGRIKKSVERKFIFKFRNLFGIVFPLKKITILNFILTTIIFVELENLNSYEIKSFFNFENEYSSNNNLSTNIWIYPPKESKNEIIFLEKNSLSDDVINSLLVEKDSQILIKVYGTDEKNVNVKLTKNSRKKFLKKIDYFENTTTFKGILIDGEYKIVFRDKVFQKIIINIDKNPQIKFTDKPLIDSNNLIFNYLLKDENNDVSFLEIKSSSLVSKANTRPDNSVINKVSNKPASYIRLSKNINQINNSSNIIRFSQNLINHPLSGKDVIIRLKSYDLNQNYGESEVYRITLPAIKFLNKYANEIILIRKKYYENENNTRLFQELEKFSKKIQEPFDFIKPKIRNLISFLNVDSIPAKAQFERVINELFSIATLIEKNSNEYFKEEILKLKNELKKLIERNASDNELEPIMEKIQRLIEKLDNTEKKEKKKQENENSFRNDTKNSTLDQAKNLINLIDNLLGEKKISELNSKNVSNILKNSHKEQNKLIQKTYKQKSSENSEELSKEQERIKQKILRNKNEILDVIPNSKKEINKLIKSLDESFDALKNKQIKKSMEKQKLSIDIIESLEKEIRSKSVLKENEKENKKQSVKDVENKDNLIYDIPIIFEKNEYEKIIQEIRRIINEDNTSQKEKNYLKELLPKF